MPCCVLLGCGHWTRTLLGAPLCVLPVLFGSDPLGIQSELRASPQSDGMTDYEKDIHMPSNAANLPPLCSANDSLHHIFASECLDKMCRGFVAGGQGNDKADNMD